MTLQKCFITHGTDQPITDVKKNAAKRKILMFFFLQIFILFLNCQIFASDFKIEKKNSDKIFVLFFSTSGKATFFQSQL
jgi:hypothetical protein